MNRHVVLLPSIILTLAVLTSLASASPQPDNDNMWAVIICGDMMLQADTKYLYDVLEEHYHFTEILYLHPNAETYECLNKTIVRWAIRDWLGERSNDDDLIFIFMLSHGGGMQEHNATHYVLEGGRWELNSDEGNETSEATLGREFLGYYDWGIDFNGNDIIEYDVYAGVDECIWIQTKHNISDYPPVLEHEPYWDDEVKEDLDTLSYGRLVCSLCACKIPNQTQSCFSGGFVRDLSAPNRIIITSSNETSYSVAYPLSDADFGYTYAGHFSRPFINALDPDNSSSLADVDDNSLVSVEEAWQYAWDNDIARSPGVWVEGELLQETPWLDDDGDGVPNHSDGALSNETFFASDMGKLCDLNDDHVVDSTDCGIFGLAWGSFWFDVLYNPKCDFYFDGAIDSTDDGIFGIYWGYTY